MIIDDRGEKIITLARAMLRSDIVMDPQPPAASPGNAVSLKVLCLAAVLAAASGSVATVLVGEWHRPITRYEKTELEALMFYAVHLKGVNETTLRHDIQSKLGVAHFDDLTEQDFHAVRRWLQDKAQ